jgi:hypothetical protein
VSTLLRGEYRKKPVVITAIQLGDTKESLAAVMRFTADGGVRVALDEGAVIIPTLEGKHRADIGDWIIRGVAGEFYPCKPDIFAATYESADGEKEQQ